jgi:ATP-binding cassette subfamily B protein
VPHWKAERQASADFFGFLEERLAGTEDIRANGAEAYTLRNFHALIRQMLRTSLKAGMMNNILYNTLQFLYAAGIATAFALSAYLFQDGVITLGTVFLIFQYATMLERPIDSITHQIGQLQRASAGILRIQELLAVKNKIVEPQTPIERASVKPGGALALKFDAVTFGYDDAPPVAGARPKGEITPKNGSPSQTGEVAPAGDEQSPKEIVLHDLSFTLEAGKVLGLLGRTGSGKTTLTRLLFRFYDPDQGTVLLGADGLTDLRQLPLQTLRQQVGMVTQNIQLFNASVRDNLTFFDRSVPDVQIEAVIAELGLSEWFRALPQGLDTVLESGGGGLSAGEAQLLAFTRIFLANPGLVVLDEASSRLDPATESLIERAVERLVQGRTAIIIAHRLGTVQKADEIMILNQGRIEEHGERQALAGDPGSRFFQLLQTGLEEVLV